MDDRQIQNPAYGLPDNAFIYRRQMEHRLGIDVGSTTVKLVLLDEKNNIAYSKYERHMSSVFEKAGEMLKELLNETGNIPLRAVITGSGGLSLADLFGIKFEQEVISCSKAVEELIPDTDVAIELGEVGS